MPIKDGDLQYKLLPSLQRGIARVGQQVPLINSSSGNALPVDVRSPRSKRNLAGNLAENEHRRPNLPAYRLRTGRSNLIRLVAPDLGTAHVARITAVIESLLRRRGYSLLVGSHQRDSERIGIRPDWPLSPRVDGIVAIDRDLRCEGMLPTVSIDFQGMLFEEPLTAEVSEWLLAESRAAVRGLLRRIDRYNECSRDFESCHSGPRISRLPAATTGGG